MDAQEIWKDVVGYEGRYLVSNLGRIKSVERIVKSSSGFRIVRERFIKYCYVPKRYVIVSLSDGSGKSNSKSVHRIIALAFIPNPLGKKYINHKDGNKHNNLISNLEWCTQSENQKHAISLGLATHPVMRGDDSPVSKLNHIDIQMIKILGGYDFTNEQIAKRFGVHPTHIGLIKRSKTWKHLSQTELNIKL